MALRLLPDAEIAEDGIEQFLDIDAAGDAADGAQRQAQIFRKKFGLITRRDKGMTQRIQRISQRLTMARPGQGRGFTLCFQHFRHPARECFDQLWQAFAALERKRQTVFLLEIGADRAYSTPQDQA